MEREFSRKVQGVAKTVLCELTQVIRPGVSERKIAERAETLMRDSGVSDFWYHGVAALVLVGERTTLSISGREYESSSMPVKVGDLVTVDLSPMIDNHWGDCARSFVVDENQTYIDRYDGNNILSRGLKAEHLLHERLIETAKPDQTFEEIFFSMNQYIEELGFKNLDFLGNLGHSIESDLSDRRYLEKGEQTTLGEVYCFTFEPHIQSTNGGPGFKRENIYYFCNDQIREL